MPEMLPCSLMIQIFTTFVTSTDTKWWANGRIRCTSDVCPWYV